MISAVVLTHNSESSLEKTLVSIAWCDEIVVIDDNSTDTTVDIAKKFHAKIFTRSLENDFSTQRNFGLEKAKGEWVLFVDSDEVISPKLALEIQQPKMHDGYFIKRTDIFWNKKLQYGETGNMALLRLAKKDVGKWIHPVHEVWEIKGETGVMNHPILHYAHPNVAQFLEQINTYSSMQANYLFSKHTKEPGWRVVVNPFGKFFVNYILRLGFLDSVEGTIYACMMSFHSFLVRAKLWHLWQKSA